MNHNSVLQLKWLLILHLSHSYESIPTSVLHTTSDKNYSFTGCYSFKAGCSIARMLSEWCTFRALIATIQPFVEGVETNQRLLLTLPLGFTPSFL